LLKLAEECSLAQTESQNANAPCAQYHSLFTHLSANLRPITQVVRDGWIAYLPKLTFPVRSGVHSNTAFGLALSHDYAREVSDEDLKRAINACAIRLYGEDVGYNPAFEPSGEDFLSPGLCEMELMKRVMPSPAVFTSWSERFMPSLLETPPLTDATSGNSILRMPTVSDRTDARICHLDGLLLSKAWNLRSIAPVLSHGGVSPQITDALLASAREHYAAASWMAGDYVGSHWLHSFALLALDVEEPFQ